MEAGARYAVYIKLTSVSGMILWSGSGTLMQYGMPPVMGRRCQVYLSNGEVVQSHRTRCGVLIFVKGSCLWLWRAWVEGGLSVRCSSFRVESGLGIELVPAKDCLTWNISGLCGEDGLSCIPTISAGVCSGMNCVLQQCYTGLGFSKREMCKWTAGQQRSGTGLQTRYRG